MHNVKPLILYATTLLLLVLSCFLLLGSFVVSQDQQPTTTTVDNGKSTTTFEFEPVEFLKLLNYFQRTDQFHPLKDINNRHKKTILNLSKFVLDPVDLQADPQKFSKMLKLVPLTPVELSRLTDVFNNVIQKVNQLPNNQIYTHVHPRLPEQDNETIEDRINRLKEFISYLFQLYKTRDYNFQKQQQTQQTDNEIKLLVVGHGPIGFLSAIESSLLLRNVTIMEKRKDYTRDVLFDLYQKPYSQAVEILTEIGFDSEFPEIEIHVEEADDGEDVPSYTMRCQLNQRFLSKILYLMENVNLLYAHQYVSQCAINNDEVGVALVLNSDNRDCQHSLEAMKREEAEDICKNVNQEMVKIPTGQQCQLKRIPFDILIGSDGLYSNVRQSLNIATKEINTFDLSQTIFHDQFINKALIPKITVKPKLNQVALLINFEKDAQGECPNPAIDPSTGDTIDPWKYSFIFDNVRAIFTRFLGNHCNLQILYDFEYGDKVLTRYNEARENTLQKILNSGSGNKNIVIDAEARDIRSSAFGDTIREYDLFNVNATNTNITNNNDNKTPWEEDAFDWEYILKIVNTVLQEKYATVDALKAAIQKHPNSSRRSPVSKYYDMILLNVILQRAERLTHTMPLKNNQKRPFALTILKGDAVAAAHFRLGVGVNNAYIAFGELTQLFQQLINNPQDQANALQKGLEEYEKKATHRWDRLISYMATAMYFESYCNTAVFMSPGDNHFGYQAIHEKDTITQEFVVFETLSQAKRQCQKYDKLSVWWN